MHTIATWSFFKITVYICIWFVYRGSYISLQRKLCMPIVSPCPLSSVVLEGSHQLGPHDTATILCWGEAHLGARQLGAVPFRFMKEKQ